MHLRALVLALSISLRIAAQNSAVDVLHYDVAVTLAPDVDAIAASAELTVRPLITPLESLLLDFGALQIEEVTVDGEPATWERSGERVAVRVRTKSADPFRVRIVYRGTPTDGLILRKNKHGAATAFADNWPNRAHHWFPSVDHPSDKASVTFTVTAPSRFAVVANGTRIAIEKEGDITHTRWSEPAQIPVHCMVIGAAEFAIDTSAPRVEYWLYPRDRERGIAQFGRVPQMLAYFSEVIGPYPYEKLALVESSTRFGGMENASAIFFDEHVIGGAATLEHVVAHEIAHQWFGDSVSQREWHDLWLSEGFATYFENLFFEHADGRAALRERMKADRETYLTAQRKSPRAIHDRSIVALPKLLSPFTYEKAAWVLHMLRGIMGDDAFFAAVRDYYAGYRDRNANTAELRVIFERHAGQPLDWFFRQWIYAPGHPIFATTWNWRDGKVMLRVEQTQSGAPFRVPMAVELRDAEGARREQLVIDERREQFELDSDREPTSVVLDPDEWVLKEEP